MPIQILIRIGIKKNTDPHADAKSFTHVQIEKKKIYLSLDLIKDVQATGEGFSPQ